MPDPHKVSTPYCWEYRYVHEPLHDSILYMLSLPSTGVTVHTLHVGAGNPDLGTLVCKASTLTTEWSAQPFIDQQPHGCSLKA